MDFTNIGQWFTFASPLWGEKVGNFGIFGFLGRKASYIHLPTWNLARWRGPCGATNFKVACWVILLLAVARPVMNGHDPLFLQWCQGHKVCEIRGAWEMWVLRYFAMLIILLSSLHRVVCYKEMHVLAVVDRSSIEKRLMHVCSESNKHTLNAVHLWTCLISSTSQFIYL